MILSVDTIWQFVFCFDIQVLVSWVSSKAGCIQDNKSKFLRNVIFRMPLQQRGHASTMPSYINVRESFDWMEKFELDVRAVLLFGIKLCAILFSEPLTQSFIWGMILASFLFFIQFFDGSS